VAPAESDKLCLNRRTYAAADLNPRSISITKSFDKAAQSCRKSAKAYGNMPGSKKTAPRRYGILYPDDFRGQPAPPQKKIKQVHSFVLTFPHFLQKKHSFWLHYENRDVYYKAGLF